MREKKSGTIVWMGSVGGWRSGAYYGLYSTTKWALRSKSYDQRNSNITLKLTQLGISAALHEEISSLGLRSTCIDFGYFRTNFLQSDHRAPAVSRIPDYQIVSDAVEKGLQGS